MPALALAVVVISGLVALCAMELSIKAGFEGDAKKRARTGFRARFAIAVGAAAFAYIVMQGPGWAQNSAVCAVLGWALAVVYIWFPHRQFLAQVCFAPKQPNP